MKVVQKNPKKWDCQKNFKVKKSDSEKIEPLGEECKLRQKIVLNKQNVYPQGINFAYLKQKIPCGSCLNLGEKDRVAFKKGYSNF